MMQFMSAFGSVSRADLKDCIADENQIMYIVKKGDLSQAIGKQAINVHKLERAFKRRIKMVEFNENVITFILNIIAPLKVREAQEEGSIIILTPIDSKTRGMLIGRAASNLRAIEAIAKRYFSITEIKVL